MLFIKYNYEAVTNTPEYKELPDEILRAVEQIAKKASQLTPPKFCIHSK